MKDVVYREVEKTIKAGFEISINDLAKGGGIRVSIVNRQKQSQLIKIVSVQELVAFQGGSDQLIALTIASCRTELEKL